MGERPPRSGAEQHTSMLQRLLDSEGLQQELRAALRESIALQRSMRTGHLLDAQGLHEPLRDALIALGDAQRTQAEAVSTTLRLSSRLDDVEARCATLTRERDELRVAVTALEARLVALEQPSIVETSSPPEPPRSSGMGFRLIDAPPGALPHHATDLVVIDRRHTPFGSIKGEPGRSGDEVLQRTVALPKRFAIQRAPVTNALWDEVMEVRDGDGEPDHPKTSITFAEARRFCNALSSRDGLDAVYTLNKGSVGSVHIQWEHDGYRLPLEVEWEAAARAGLTGTCYGAADTVWSEENTTQTQPVMRLQPNSLGLYDMLGNVRELCMPALLDELPSYVLLGEFVPVRGGSRRFSAIRCRFDTRQNIQHRYRSDDIGFRVVRTLGAHQT